MSTTLIQPNHKGYTVKVIQWERIIIILSWYCYYGSAVEVLLLFVVFSALPLTLCCEKINDMYMRCGADDIWYYPSCIGTHVTFSTWTVTNLSRPRHDEMGIWGGIKELPLCCLSFIFGSVWKLWILLHVASHNMSWRFQPSSDDAVICCLF